MTDLNAVPSQAEIDIQRSTSDVSVEEEPSYQQVTSYSHSNTNNNNNNVNNLTIKKQAVKGLKPMEKTNHLKSPVVKSHNKNKKKKNNNDKNKKRMDKNNHNNKNNRNNNNKKKNNNKNKNKKYDRDNEEQEEQEQDENESEDLTTDASDTNITATSDTESMIKSEARSEDGEERSENKEKDLQGLSNIKREERPSNLVRINTNTNWTKSQLDELEKQLREQIAAMASQNDQGYICTQDPIDIQTTKSLERQSTRSSDQLGSTTEDELKRMSSHRLMKENEADAWTTPQINKRAQEMRDYLEYLKAQHIPPVAQHTGEAMVEKSEPERRSAVLPSDGSASDAPIAAATVTPQVKRIKSSPAILVSKETAGADIKATPTKGQDGAFTQPLLHKSKERDTVCLCRCTIL